VQRKAKVVLNSFFNRNRFIVSSLLSNTLLWRTKTCIMVYRTRNDETAWKIYPKHSQSASASGSTFNPNFAVPIWCNEHTEMKQRHFYSQDTKSEYILWRAAWVTKCNIKEKEIKVHNTATRKHRNVTAK